MKNSFSQNIMFCERIRCKFQYSRGSADGKAQQDTPDFSECISEETVQQGEDSGCDDEKGSVFCQKVFQGIESIQKGIQGINRNVLHRDIILPFSKNPCKVQVDFSTGRAILQVRSRFFKILFLLYGSLRIVFCHRFG